MPDKIPYLTQARYDALFKQFLMDERSDIGSSETVLGESYFESPIKVIFEHVLLNHLKTFCADFIGTNTPEEKEELPDYAYCEPHKSETSVPEKTFSSANELLKKAIASHSLYKIIDIEISSRTAQTTYANIIILHINDLLGFVDD